MITKRTGILRVVYATYFSMKGLRAAFLSEAAFRQEVLVLVILIPIAFCVDVTSIERILLVMSLLIVLITELLNTAIEKLCDHVSTDIHLLIGRANDWLGSRIHQSDIGSVHLA